MRNDLTNSQRAVQSCHACIEVTSLFDKDIRSHPHIVLCGVKSEYRLLKEIDRLSDHGIPLTIWKEPDLDNTVTAIATVPISGSQRKLFRKFQLIK